MSKPAVSVEAQIDGVWTDLTILDAVYATPITVKRGGTGSSGAFVPGTITGIRLDNRTDRYRPSNPDSDLYGKLNRGTPMRVTVDGSIRMIGKCTYIAPDESDDFRAFPPRGEAWVDIETSGLIFDVNTSTKELQSAMTRNLASSAIFATAVGAWTLEDGSEATSFGNSLTNGGPGVITAGTVTPAGHAGAAGAAVNVAEMGIGGKVRFTFLTATVDQWQVLVHLQMPTAPSTGVSSDLFKLTLSNKNTFTWQVNSTNWTFTVANSKGTVLSTYTSTFGVGISTTSWLRLRVKATVTAGTVKYEPAWYDDGSSATFGVTMPTYSAASVGKLKWCDIAQGLWTDGAGYSHVIGITDTTVNALSDDGLINTFRGYAGEDTVGRFLRLLGEEGYTAGYIGGGRPLIPMGRQRPDTLVAQLTECARTEDALVHDRGNAFGVIISSTYTRLNKQDRTNSQVRLRTADLIRAPREVVDLQDVSNDVTVKQRDGATSQAVDTTSSMSTQAAPYGINPQPTTVTVNIDDETDLPEWSSWYLNRGTIEDARFPTVEVDMTYLKDNEPATWAAMLSLWPAYGLCLVDRRENELPMDIIGWTETITPIRHTIAFECAPDRIWIAGVYGTTRWDVDSCTTASAVDAGATSLPVTFSSDEEWGTAVPYDIIVAGMRATVTAVGARSGSGPYTQTLTIAPGQNGVLKAIPAGSSVHLFDNRRWALGLGNNPTTTGTLAYGGDLYQHSKRLDTVIANSDLYTDKWAIGVQNITPVANTATSVVVTGLDVDGGTFAGFVTANTTGPGGSVVECTATGATSTGVTLWIYRTNTTVTGLSYVVAGF